MNYLKACINGLINKKEILVSKLSNIGIRIFSAILMGSGAVFLILAGPIELLLFILSIGLTYCLFEWFRLFGQHLSGYRFLFLLLLVEILFFSTYLSFLIVPYAFFMNIASFMIIIQVVLLMFFLWGYSKNALQVKYIFVWKLGGFFVALINIICITFLVHIDVSLFLYAFSLVWVADSGAWVVGYFFGKRPFMTHISPKKTWEGFIGGYVFTLASSYGLLVFDLKGFFLVSKMEFLSFIVLISLVFLAVMMGDLLMSATKRLVGVKDTGKLLPGHGGLLDRLDGALFALPVFCFVFFVSTHLSFI